MDLKDLVERVEFADQVELIDVMYQEKGQKRLALMRSKVNPDVAFLVWTSFGYSTRAAIIFRLKAGGRTEPIRVACACCVGLGYGRPVFNQCKKLGIKHLFVRNGYREWKFYFPEEVVEIEDPCYTNLDVFKMFPCIAAMLT